MTTAKHALIVGTMQRKDADGNRLWFLSPENRILLTCQNGTIHWETKDQPRTPIGMYWDGQRWGTWPECLASRSVSEVTHVFDMVAGKGWKPTLP